VRLEVDEAHAEIASLKEMMRAGPTSEMYVGLVKELQQLKDDMKKTLEDKSKLESDLVRMYACVCVCARVCVCVCAVCVCVCVCVPTSEMYVGLWLKRCSS
jgi:hypothetical protein